MSEVFNEVFRRVAGLDGPRPTSADGERWALDPDPRVRGLACKADVSTETVERLAVDEYHNVRMDAAAHKNASAGALSHLAVDANEFVRSAAVQNPSCPVDAIRSAFDVGFTDDLALLPALNNPNVPADILVDMAGDEQEYTRAVVALHPNCPPHVLAVLASDAVELVRTNVVRNPNAPEFAATYAVIAGIDATLAAAPVLW